MSLNSSSSTSLTTSSFLHDGIYGILDVCLKSTAGAVNFRAFTITSILILLLPFSLVLCLGLQQWWQQHSMSHSDHITYHTVSMDMLSVFGCITMWCGMHTDIQQMKIVGLYLFCTNIMGQIVFHLLACVERYLAVVHPVTYRNLRKAKWIKIRKITIGCVWLIGFAMAGVIFVDGNGLLAYMFISAEVLVTFIISLFNLCILCVLIRPGPGKEVRGRQQVDQTKLRALHTMALILGVLLLRLSGNIITTSMYSYTVGEPERCVVLLLGIWFTLPSSLVLPLLFLQRNGKNLCQKNSNQTRA